MSDNARTVAPLVIDANSTLQAVAALVAQVRLAGSRAWQPPVEWVLLRATRGFTVSWYLLRFDDLVSNTSEPFDPARTIADAVRLDAHRPIPAVQLGDEPNGTGPRVVLAGTRVFGLVPPRLMAKMVRGTTRGGRAAARGRDSTAFTPAPAGGSPPPAPAPAVRLDAAAFVNAPRRVLAGKRFTMEIGLAATPVPGVQGGKVRIDFQAGETEVPLAVHLQCEGFTCEEGTDHTLVIPRNDPFTPRLMLHLASGALAPGIADELRAVQVTYAVRGLTCGVATWRLLVQRDDVAVEPPTEAPPRVAINTATPAIDLTLTSAWKDDTEASQTLCWSYSTPHQVPAPTRKLVRSSPELAVLPLGIVDELAQGDGVDGIERLMDGIAKRIADEIPAGVWEVLRSVTDAVHAARGKDAVPTVLIVTQETRVPWELALLPDDRFPPAPGAPEILRVIGTEYIVSRWLLDDNLPPLPPYEIPAGDVVAVFGDYANSTVAQLPFAKKEAEYLQQQRHGIPFPAERGTILKILSNGQTAPGGAALAPRILHFAGHGEAARQGTPSSFIVLNDGTNLTSTYFLNAPVLKRHHPLVFLNACQLAAATASLAQPGGFAVVFVRSQCAAVVAPLWSVNDEVAYDVATHFYDAILATGEARRSPAAAMWQARQPRFSDVTLKDPVTAAPITRRTATRLAYLVYGHPALMA